MTNPVAATGDTLGKNLGKKLGPLPVAGWLVIAGVGIGGYLLITRRASDVRGSEGIGVDTGVPPGVGVGPGTPGFTPVTPATPTPVETNEQWSVKAIAYLTPTYGAVPATGAVARYLNGEQLAVEDVALIDAAVKALGPPPVPPQSVITTPPTSPDTGIGSPEYPWTSAAKRKAEFGRTYVTKKDNTMDWYFNAIYENRPPANSKEWWAMYAWFRFVNGMRINVRKGTELKLPTYIWLYRPPM